MAGFADIVKNTMNKYSSEYPDIFKGLSTGNEANQESKVASPKIFSGTKKNNRNLGEVQDWRAEGQENKSQDIYGDQVTDDQNETADGLFDANGEPTNNANKEATASSEQDDTLHINKTMKLDPVENSTSKILNKLSSYPYGPNDRTLVSDIYANGDQAFMDSLFIPEKEAQQAVQSAGITDNLWDDAKKMTADFEWGNDFTDLGDFKYFGDINQWKEFIRSDTMRPYYENLVEYYGDIFNDDAAFQKLWDDAKSITSSDMYNNGQLLYSTNSTNAKIQKEINKFLESEKGGSWYYNVPDDQDIKKTDRLKLYAASNPTATHEDLLRLMREDEINSMILQELDRRGIYGEDARAIWNEDEYNDMTYIDPHKLVYGNPEGSYAISEVGNAANAGRNTEYNANAMDIYNVPYVGTANDAAKVYGDAMQFQWRTTDEEQALIDAYYDSLKSTTSGTTESSQS